MNVTDWLAVPTPGVVDGVVKAKVPAITFVLNALVTTPPVRIERLNGLPLVMVEAVGAVFSSGVCGLTVTLTLVLVGVGVNQVGRREGHRLARRAHIRCIRRRGEGESAGHSRTSRVGEMIHR